MKKMGAWAAAILLVGIAGCSDPKIDGSTPEATAESIDAVRAKLAPGEKEKFDEALLVLATPDITNIFDLAFKAGRLEQNVSRRLDGKTAADVIAEADRVVADRVERERQQAQAEINALESQLADIVEKIEQQEDAAAELQKFEVTKSRVYWDDSGYMAAVVLDLGVRNGTAHPVSRAYFEGSIASPGRSIPWVSETFSYTIPGGLEPGEEASWSLKPNRYVGDWSNVPSDRDDLMFTAVAYKLDGVNGETLYDHRAQSALHEEKARIDRRLAELRKYE